MAIGSLIVVAGTEAYLKNKDGVDKTVSNFIGGLNNHARTLQESRDLARSLDSPAPSSGLRTSNSQRLDGFTSPVSSMNQRGKAQNLNSNNIPGEHGAEIPPSPEERRGDLQSTT